MEMTYEQWRLMKKDLRRRFSVVGWILLIYYAIMNAAVYVAAFTESIIRVMVNLAAGDLEHMADGLESAAGSGWGYFLAAGVGLIILLCWKKPRYLRDEIWAKGNPMKPGSFFALLCLFMSGQFLYQILAVIAELILNAFGLSLLEGMNAMAVDTDVFSMFLYTGVLAPIVEEILFRGLIQRTLMPYGKRFAIFSSAFTFGIFHGNLIQSPYAFLVGLVLGYVAAEYSIGWAMVLHMFNNLMIADVLTRLTQSWPEEAYGLLLWTVNFLFAAAALVVLILRRREIREYRRSSPINKTCLRCFFSSPGVIVLMALMGVSMIVSCFLMITPI